MRSLIFILAIITLFLAIEPGVESLLSMAETQHGCCRGQCAPESESDDSQKQNSENDCAGRFCNPFQVCSTCVLDCNNLLPGILYKPTYLESKGFSYQFTFTSQFISDFWQPPKNV